MATAESPSKKSPAKAHWPMSMKRKISYGVIAILLLAMVWLAMSWGGIKNSAHLATAYSAHIVCSCRYIEGRDMDSCETDREDGMESVSLTDDPENKRVSASIVFLSKAVAEKRGEYGCIVLNDAEIDALN